MIKKIRSSFLYTIFFSILYPTLSFGLDFKLINTKTAEHLLNTMGSCNNELWPSSKLSSLNIVLIDKDDNHVAVDLRQKKLISFDTKKLPPRLKKATYGFFEIDGQKWLSVNAREHYSTANSADEELGSIHLLRLAVHEAFHYTDQADWKRKANPYGRSTFVPIKWEPRYYRSMLFTNLSQAYFEPENRSRSLQRAKYWFKLWTKEFPEEFLANTDEKEGTALYVDTLAKAFIKTGCHPQKEVLKDELVKIVSTDKYGSIFNGQRFALDSEGYPMGRMAALLLAEDDKHSGWQQKLAEAQSPLDILFKDVSEEFQSIDRFLKQPFIEAQRTAQSDVATSLQPVYHLLNSVSSVRVSVPTSWFDLGSSYGFNGFYYDTDFKLKLSVYAEDILFKSSVTSHTLTVKSDFSELAFTDAPCKLSGFHFIVPEGAIQINASGSYSIESTHLIGNVKGTFMLDEKKQHWFCIDK